MYSFPKDIGLPDHENMSTKQTEKGLDRRRPESAGHAERRLPWELLHIIFQYTVAPNTLLVPDRCHYSAWSLTVLTTKRLITVSHDWYEAGVEFLYSDIAVFWMEQLLSLRRTLQQRPDLAVKLVSFRLACVTPPDHVEAFDSALESLVNICPNLTQVSVRFLHVHPSRFSRVLPLFSNVPLTHLAIHSDDASSSTYFVRLFAEHLVSLIVYARDSVPRTSRIDPSMRDELILPQKPSLLRLPRLRYFQHNLEVYRLRSICYQWQFPALTFLSCRRGRREFAIELLTNLEFIRTHGSKVSTLLFEYSLHRAAYVSHYIDKRKTLPTVQKIFSGMKELRHLIMPSTYDLSLPQVQHFDIITSSLEVQDVVPSIEDLEHRFPNLKSFRLLESSLISVPWIYTCLPPGTTQDYEFRFPGVDIRGTEHFLLGASSLEKRYVPDLSLDSISSSDSECSDDDASESESEADAEISDDEVDECRKNE